MGRRSNTFELGGVSVHVADVGFENRHGGMTYGSSRMMDSVSYGGAFSAKVVELGFMAFGFVGKNASGDYGSQCHF